MATTFTIYCIFVRKNDDGASSLDAFQLLRRRAQHHTASALYRYCMYCVSRCCDPVISCLCVCVCVREVAEKTESNANQFPSSFLRLLTLPTPSCLFTKNRTRGSTTLALSLLCWQPRSWICPECVGRSGSWTQQGFSEKLCSALWTRGW